MATTKKEAALAFRAGKHIQVTDKETGSVQTVHRLTTAENWEVPTKSVSFDDALEFESAEWPTKKLSYLIHPWHV